MLPKGLSRVREEIWVLEGAKLQEIAFPECQSWIDFYIFNLENGIDMLPYVLDEIELRE